MTGLQHLVSNETLGYFRQRVGDHTQVWCADDPSNLSQVLNEICVSQSEEVIANVSQGLLSAIAQPGTHAFELEKQQSLAICPLPELEGRQQYVLAVIDGPAKLSQAFLANAVEGWRLNTQVESANSALQESAMQLAQSFEEQNWLRGFARNATCFSKYTHANQMAEGILKPLGYLLRAQDVFMIVNTGETAKTGLVSAKYGNSTFTIADIVKVLDSFGCVGNSPPVVRNRVEIETDHGQINSIVCVSISNSDSARGFLVGINRCVESHPNGLPVYDAEFGSGDVGLLEEAAVLLTTQAQNMHLLLHSNELFLGTLHAMSSTIDARDPYTQGHSERVARLSFDLAKIMGLSNEACQEIYLSGILHDIGKIGIPDSVLLKPGKLTDEEFAVIQKHPEIGHRIVERLGHLQFALPGVLYHHERWDGRGYPHGLAGQAIPLMARIMAVADSFDAMTSSRPYRNAMPVEKAHGIINSGGGEQWDAEVVACFNQWLEDQQPIKAVTTENAVSIIPQDGPLEQMAQAVMTLIN